MSTQKLDKLLAPVFVVGTGRSGTTMMMRLFASHPQVFAPGIETRFIVDPGGLMDLVDTLTTRYSPSRAREALYRFERLMRVDLVTPRASPYLSVDLVQWFGERYRPACDAFCRALLLYEFKGFDAPIPEPDSGLVRGARSLHGLWRRFRRGWLPRPEDCREIIREPRYFSDRDELIGLSRAFLIDLFGRAAASNGRTMWCEKTPHHLFHLDFLFELFPDARVVHMVRDPRAVVRSVTQQFWAPSRADHAALLLESMYRAWADKKMGLDLTERNYLELRLEDVVRSPGDSLASLQRFCGLDAPFDVTQIRRSARGKEEIAMLDPAELPGVEQVLARFIDDFGYR